MSIEKQLLINSLNSPVELLDIVKSYCFYDKKTFEMIQYAKLQKERTNVIIKRAISRANNFDNHPEYHEDDGHWFFGYSIGDIEIIQLQATNCRFCGDYLYYTYINRFYHSPIIHCQCIEEDDDFNTDDLYSHNNDTEEEDEMDYHDMNYDSDGYYQNYWP